VRVHRAQQQPRGKRWTEQITITGHAATARCDMRGPFLSNSVPTPGAGFRCRMASLVRCWL
jgi:hypothetical protein